MRRALVVGGSIGGLFAANLLARSGWDVTVAERSRDALSGRGAGIVTHPALLRALERAGVPAGTPLGVAVPGRRVIARDGSVAGEHPLPQVLTSWSRLHALLEAAFDPARIRRGRHATGVDQNGSVATVRFADGETAEAELVVAADGIRSTLRNQLFPGVRATYAGYVAWRGLAEEAALSAAARDAIFGHFAFGLLEGEQMLGYPVAGAGDAVSPGHRRYNFVWYRPATRAQLDRLMTDATGQVHPDGIPPHLLDPAVVAEMRAAASALLPAPFAEVVAATAHPFVQPIMDLEVPEMTRGRLAMIGDAAYVARPHCGMGVTKAAQDAEALADSLLGGDDVAAALVAWAPARVAAGKAIVQHARHLGAYMQAGRATVEEAAMAERYRSPASVMRETAVPPPAA